MPNITGTNGNDNIDVTNDDGTLNGNPQGTPIDNIRARGGNDTISVTNSTIANNVQGNGGADDITVSGSTVSGTVTSGRGNDTVSLQGATVGNVRLGNGNDTLDFVSSTVAGDIRGNGGTDSLNLPTGTVVNDVTFGTFTVTAGGAYSLSNGTFDLPSGTTITYTTFENGTGFPCFVRGTLIKTELGQRLVEQLKAGDVIPTQEHGPKQIRWIGNGQFSSADMMANPKLRPVRIMQDALGNGLPDRDLLVSRQHRMLVQSIIAERMFGRPEVLIPTIKLTELPGIFVDEEIETVEYFHLLFDQHQIIYAEGAPTESLFTGPEALNSVSAEAQREIRTIFPDITEMGYTPEPACYIPSDIQQKQLIARHLKNNKPLLGTTRRSSH